MWRHSLGCGKKCACRQTSYSATNTRSKRRTFLHLSAHMHKSICVQVQMYRRVRDYIGSCLWSFGGTRQYNYTDRFCKLLTSNTINTFILTRYILDDGLPQCEWRYPNHYRVLSILIEVNRYLSGAEYTAASLKCTHSMIRKASEEYLTPAIRVVLVPGKFKSGP